MKFFTYNDYIDYNQNRNIRETVKKLTKGERIEQLTETEERIETITKLITRNKKENFLLINEFFNEKINSNNFDWIKLKEQKRNIKIFKERSEEKYYIFDYKIKKDNHIVYKIFKLCIEIVENWKMKNKESNYPIIYPIIIYLGDEEWDIKIQRKLKSTEIKSNGIFLSYNIIDFSKISSENLLKKESLLANVIGVKNQKEQNLEKYIRENIKYTNDIQKYQNIKRIYYYLNYKTKK